MASVTNAVAHSGAVTIEIPLGSPPAANATGFWLVFVSKIFGEVVAASILDAANLTADATNYADFRLQKNATSGSGFLAGGDDVAGPWTTRPTTPSGYATSGGVTGGVEKDLVVTDIKKDRRIVPGDRLYFQKFATGGTGANLGGRAILQLVIQGGVGWEGAADSET